MAEFTPEDQWILRSGDMLDLPLRIAHHGVALDQWSSSPLEGLGLATLLSGVDTLRPQELTPVLTHHVALDILTGFHNHGMPHFHDD